LRDDGAALVIHGDSERDLLSAAPMKTKAMPAKRAMRMSLTTFFTACHDGGVEALAQAGGHVVDLMGTIDFYGLAGGIERDFAVLTAAQMFFQISAHLCGNRIFKHIVEQGNELSASHFSTPFFLRK
jgi:hypothetical protein